MLIRITPRSSNGANSCLVVLNKKALPTAEANITATTQMRRCKAQAKARPYDEVKPVRMISMRRSNREGLSWWRNNLALSIGESVKATKPETTTAPANAKANSANKRPVRPGVKANGA